MSDKKIRIFYSDISNSHHKGLVVIFILHIVKQFANKMINNYYSKFSGMYSYFLNKENTRFGKTVMRFRRLNKAKMTILKLCYIFLINKSCSPYDRLCILLYFCQKLIKLQDIHIL